MAWTTRKQVLKRDVELRDNGRYGPTKPVPDGVCPRCHSRVILRIRTLESDVVKCISCGTVLTEEVGNA